MLKLLQLTAAECASSTSETTSESQRKSKIPHPATGGQTARIPGITRFSIPVHTWGRASHQDSLGWHAILSLNGSRASVAVRIPE
ncbi:MAG: hypothetical protein ACLPZ0_21810, partial [Steroidobacteraceae bacterium]